MASGLHLLFSERAARARAGLAAQEVER
jgi:hypothetical protein